MDTLSAMSPERRRRATIVLAIIFVSLPVLLVTAAIIDPSAATSTPRMVMIETALGWSFLMFSMSADVDLAARRRVAEGQ